MADFTLVNTNLTKVNATVATVVYLGNKQGEETNDYYKHAVNEGLAPPSTTYVAPGAIKAPAPIVYFNDIVSNPPDSKAPPNTPANVPASTAAKIEETSPKANDPTNTIDQSFLAVTPSVNNYNSNNGVITKSAADAGMFLEIRPSLRRLPDENPFLVEMIDARGQTCNIQYPDNTIVMALKIAPNPETLTINDGKIINRYNTMTRWIEEHWSDEMSTVSFSGSTFSFMAFVTSSTGPGLSVTNRRSTQSYQMLKELVRFYRANGCIYQDESTYIPFSQIVSSATGDQTNTTSQAFLTKFPTFAVNHPRQGLVRERLYIKLTFDYVSFIGYFESFDITEDSTKPYKLIYNAIFKSEKTVYLLG